ncbi:hypothetical protein [Bradyrhizobium sp. NP1]|uniref:hypothetical protein n=1 Tax=Bradyrhizobium sp. NP1 TaxID=3049772 RepID=UPI0025A50D97|nr:hypothetical protein [Bradyrhizobium sp. NP1]WJR74836.1 hypothetical protein QOU61_18560 [Bradyrhizobium sp. NP1]
MTARAPRFPRKNLLQEALACLRKAPLNLCAAQAPFGQIAKAQENARVVASAT